MADLIREFNDKIEKYLKVCLEAGQKIDCHEESYLLTEEKVKTIYNKLIKERNVEKDPQNYKELLEELKSTCTVNEGYKIQQLPNSNEEIDDIDTYTVNAMHDYQASKQNILIRSYTLGYALHHLKNKYHYREWDHNLQEFFKKNNFKMKKSAESNLRKFYNDIGPYRKLLFIDKSYTELRRLLPRIKEAFVIYPEEEDFWKL